QSRNGKAVGRVDLRVIRSDQGLGRQDRDRSVQMELLQMNLIALRPSQLGNKSGTLPQHGVCSWNTKMQAIGQSLEIAVDRPVVMQCDIGIDMQAAAQITVS